ncbi:aldo/keto reductase [Corynebacterium phocae]|uniref:Aldo/keto reductase n=1 Tax=Corynebacterium phocae TaxID=161895 RepID=A0A1L7D4I7_9CORY|nr:aldo/keto reductase [Corynebacterium phocae]APT93025.1 aldo/keto reductase [Corynebacterium phocae]KAA8722515.1 aldo/keto reductase [Corynebacterium phocae]
MTNFAVPSVTFNDDREMPLLGLGTYKMQGKECERAVREAIELGYRKFDTATLYDNEEAVGKALTDAFAAGDVDRDEVFVTTKVWHTHHGEEGTTQAFQESMGKLGLDYLDLYLIHWPYPQGGRYVETFEQMAKLQGMGQIASIGVANFYEETLEDLITKVGITPVLNQVELHPGFTQAELRKFHADHDVVTEAWSPLARGVVLGNPDIQDIAAEVGATAGQVVLRHLLNHGISVIPKTSQPERLKENLESVNVELNDEHMARIDALDTRKGFGRMFPDPRRFPDV